MKRYTLHKKVNRDAFVSGMRDGLPIGMGYFAVAFSLGIAAKRAGLTAFQGFLVSLLCNASAGEYVGFTLIAASATYIEIAIATLVANARYLLMSCAMAQRIDPEMSFFHRFIMAFNITDELFGINIARNGYLNPCYSYGAVVTSMPLWAFGTMFGVIAGNILPLRVVSALSVALYGMFLAIIIPPAKKNKIIAVLIVISFSLSFTAGYIPLVNTLSEGTRTIILTVLISAGAAIFFPVKEEKENEG